MRVPVEGFWSSMAFVGLQFSWSGGCTIRPPICGPASRIRRHRRPAQEPAAVSFMTSSRVVSPFSSFFRPSIRSVSIPSSMAAA